MNEQTPGGEDERNAAVPDPLLEDAKRTCPRGYRFLGWLSNAAASDILPLHLTWIFTLLLAIFAAVAWRESVKGTETSQNQLKILGEQLKILKDEQRPWVYPVGASADISFFSDSSVIGDVTVKIQNAGKQPAAHLYIFGILEPATDIALKSYTKSCEEIGKERDTVRVGLFDVHPKLISSIPNVQTIYTTAFPTPEGAKIVYEEGKSSIIAAFGCINYKSIDQTSHSTLFHYNIKVTKDKPNEVYNEVIDAS